MTSCILTSDKPWSVHQIDLTPADLSTTAGVVINNLWNIISTHVTVVSPSLSPSRHPQCNEYYPNSLGEEGGGDWREEEPGGGNLDGRNLDERYLDKRNLDGRNQEGK